MANRPWKWHHGTMAPAPPGQPGHAPNLIVRPYFPNAGGLFLFGLEEPKQWQIECPVCDDGSWDEASLPPEIRALRGPYPSRESAWEAAGRHMGLTPRERLMIKRSLDESG
jgi:hypothetical protein